jgi:hypothetical protein
MENPQEQGSFLFAKNWIVALLYAKFQLNNNFFKIHANYCLVLVSWQRQKLDQLIIRFEVTKRMCKFYDFINKQLKIPQDHFPCKYNLMNIRVLFQPMNSRFITDYKYAQVISVKYFTSGRRPYSTVSHTPKYPFLCVDSFRGSQSLRGTI